MRLLISLLAILLPLFASAQPREGQDWWACQSVASAGLHWESGQWKSTGFNHNSRFILMAEGDGLSKESVAKAMGVSGLRLECGLSANLQCLQIGTGTSFGFNPNTGTGATARFFGAITAQRSDGYKDSVHVKPFECAKG